MDPKAKAALDKAEKGLKRLTDVVAALQAEVTALSAAVAELKAAPGPTPTGGGGPGEER